MRIKDKSLCKLAAIFDTVGGSKQWRVSKLYRYFSVGMQISMSVTYRTINSLSNNPSRKIIQTFCRQMAPTHSDNITGFVSEIIQSVEPLMSGFRICSTEDFVRFSKESKNE